MRTLFIFLFVAIVSLIVYNPQLDDFHEYFEGVTQQSQFDKERSALMTRMFTPDTVSLNARSSSYSTERNSFLIFSTYNIHMHVDDDDFLLGRYLGIAGMFFDLGGGDPANAYAAQP